MPFFDKNQRLNWFRIHYSGYSSRKLEAKPVVVLQAYIDDSGLGARPTSVLAGWLAPATTWANFSEDWQRMLDGPPAIPYFKLREIRSRAGSARNLSPQERLDRERQAIEVCLKHKLIPFCCIVGVDEYEKARAALPFNVKGTLYHALAYATMFQVVDYLYEKGIDGKVDFIFDEQMRQQQEIQDTWYLIKHFSEAYHRRRLGATPVFSSDHVELPIQAADALAWYYRRQGVRRIEGKSIEEPPWAKYMDEDKRNEKFGFISVLIGPELLRTITLMSSFIEKDKTKRKK